MTHRINHPNYDVTKSSCQNNCNACKVIKIKEDHIFEILTKEQEHKPHLVKSANGYSMLADILRLPFKFTSDYPMAENIAVDLTNLFHGLPSEELAALFTSLQPKGFSIFHNLYYETKSSFLVDTWHNCFLKAIEDKHIEPCTAIKLLTNPNDFGQTPFISAIGSGDANIVTAYFKLLLEFKKLFPRHIYKVLTHRTKQGNNSLHFIVARNNFAIYSAYVDFVTKTFGLQRGFNVLRNQATQYNNNGNYPTTRESKISNYLELLRNQVQEKQKQDKIDRPGNSKRSQEVRHNGVRLFNNGKITKQTSTPKAKQNNFKVNIEPQTSLGPTFTVTFNWISPTYQSNYVVSVADGDTTRSISPIPTRIVHY